MTLALSVLCFSGLRAQTQTPLLKPDEVPFDFYERGPYRPDVPRPATLLGYEPGEFHTTYANYERFLRELAAHTDRLRIMTIGQTPEHRPLYLLAVSAPENLAKLDVIKDRPRADWPIRAGAARPTPPPSRHVPPCPCG